MKITMADGFTFEGTQAEYEAFLAFAEAQMDEQEAEYIPQEGDIVVITANTNESANKVGETGKITKLGDFGFGERAKVEVIGRTYFDDNNTKLNEFRKATPAEVEAYEKALADVSKPKLKAGDFVKITEKSHYFTPDKLYEVFEKDGVLLITDDDGDELYAVLEVGSYKLATAEEVAKHADEVKWSQIGRKVGEFKKGDIVRIIDQYAGEHVVGALGVVVKDEITEDKDPLVLAVCEDGSFEDYYSIVEIVAPVESTLN